MDAIPEQPCYICVFGRFLCVQQILTMATLLVFLGGCTNRSSQPSSTSNVKPAAFLFPSHSVLVDPFQRFSWTPVENASGYYLQIGTVPGARDVFNVGDLPPNITSWAVDNLLPGVRYYATLKTIMPGPSFLYSDITFETADQQPKPTDPATLYATVKKLTGSVRLSADMFSNLPTPKTSLADEVSLRGRTVADCTDYSYTLIDLLQQQHIYARRVTLTLVGNYWLGHTTVEYYDPFQAKWSVADPTFGLIYFDDSTQTGQSAAELSNFVFLESWSSIKPKFVTANLDQYLTHYYLDPVTMFLNIVPEGSVPQNSIAHDPTQFMVPASIGTQGLYAFEFSSSEASLRIDNPSGAYNSGTILVQAEDGTRWSAIAPLNDGATVTSDATDVLVFTPRRVLF